MASVFGMARNLRRKLKLAPHFLRFYSKVPLLGEHKTCCILGQHGLTYFPRERMTEMRMFLLKKPMQYYVPASRLFKDLDYAKMTHDEARYLSFTGLFLPHYSKYHKKSYSGSFTLDNVGVIEDLGILAYKDLVEDEEKKWLLNDSAGYNEYGAFLEGLYSQPPFCSPPPDMASVISSLRAPIVIDEDIIDHAAFLSDLQYGDMATEVHRILRQEFRVTRGSGSMPFKSNAAKKILQEIGKEHQNALQLCQNHALLNEFLPPALRNRKFMAWRVKISGSDGLLDKVGASFRRVNVGTVGSWTGSELQDQLNFLNGKLLVDLNRIASVHSVEELTAWVYTFMRFSGSHFSRIEVIQLVRFLFSLSLVNSFKAFKIHNEWSELQARVRKPIPSIFLAPGKKP